MTTLAILLAEAGFGSLWMLGWGVTALLPLLLHLWIRQRYQETDWAAMKFLLAASQQRSRRIRLEQILLLILRIAIPLLLAIALANPVWQTSRAERTIPLQRSSRHHLLVIDTSYSMGYVEDSQSRLAQAKKIAVDIVSSAPQGDGFTLITMANPAQVVVTAPAFATDDMLRELAALAVADTPSRLIPVLEKTHQTLRNVAKRYPGLSSHRVYFLSDFGVNTWAEVTTPTAREMVAEIDAISDIRSINVGASRKSNRGIRSVTHRPSLITTDVVVTWQVEVERFTETETAQQTLELRVGGIRIAQQTVASSPSKQTFTFQHRFDRPGQHLIDYQLHGDGLAADNRYYEVIQVRERVAVLCVEGTSGAARYVAHAISPYETGALQATTIPDYSLEEVALDDYECIFFCNVAQFTDAQSQRLRRFLDQGKSLVFFSGDRVRSENYNRIMGRSGSDLLPAHLGANSPVGDYRFASQDYAHPVIEPFRGQDRAGLLTTPIWCYTQLKTHTDASVVLAFDNGDPAIAERRVGRGRVTFIGTAASDHSRLIGRAEAQPWNAWYVWPSFLPVVQELIQQSVAGQQELWNVSVGAPIRGILPVASQVHGVTLQHQESKVTWRVPVQEDHLPPSWTATGLYQAGFYSANVSDELPNEFFAANVAVGDESTLSQVAIPELPVPFQNQLEVMESKTANDDNPAPLFRWVLGLLAALLATETMTAWYLGKSRA